MATEITPFKDIPFIGPNYLKSSSKRRKTLPIIANETPSSIPSLFLEDPNGKVEKNEKNDKERDNSVQEVFLRVFPTLTFDDELECVQKLEEDIMQQAYLRFQLLHLQFLMVYETQQKFSYAGAIAQVGILSSASKNIISPIDLEEAHTATLPCLLLEKDEEQYVFAHGSFFEKVQNTTMKLPAANSVDSWIDGEKKLFKNKNLRDVAIELVNRNAQGKTDPYKAIRQFIKSFSCRVEKYASLEKKEAAPKAAAVFYKKAAAFCLTSLKKSSQEKMLCFAAKIEGPVNKKFFLKVQEGIHAQLKQEMLVQKKLHDFSHFLPFGDAQDVYAKAWLSSGNIHSLVARYFKKSNSLEKDWEVVAEATPSKTGMLSKSLKKIATATCTFIKTTYNVKRIQNFGSIMRLMLFSASLTLSPKTTDLYKLPKTPVLQPTRNHKAKTEGAEEDLSTLKGTPAKHVVTCLESEMVKDELKDYFKNIKAEDLENDLENVPSITHSKIHSISKKLKEVAGSCLKAIVTEKAKSRMPNNFGKIVYNILMKYHPE